MTEESPFHDGERAVQELVGERLMADRNGAVIGQRIPKGAVPFLARQRFIVVGTVDETGTPWASLLFGEKGFAESDDEGKLIDVDLMKCHMASADVLWRNLRSDDRVGLLAIELDRRRRLRVNGRVVHRDDDHSLQLLIEVEQAYPNCPKYIQSRHMGDFKVLDAEAGPVAIGTALTAEQRALIRAADTFFVASVNGAGGVDASHRGGPVGFVSVADDGYALRIPDYAGNSMYNTLGNIRNHSRAGVVFIDFETSRVVQIAGAAQISFDEPDPGHATGGTGRFWELQVDAVREWNLGMHIKWELLDMSPYNPVPIRTSDGEDEVSG